MRTNPVGHGARVERRARGRIVLAMMLAGACATPAWSWQGRFDPFRVDTLTVLYAQSAAAADSSERVDDVSVGSDTSAAMKLPDLSRLRLTRERGGFTAGDPGLAVGVLSSTGWFVLMKHDREKWVAGSNLGWAALFNLVTPEGERASHWPLPSRLAFVGGMSALSVYELQHGAEMHPTRLFWVNATGVLLTVLVTDYLFVKD